jgi:hypothetical protein
MQTFKNRRCRYSSGSSEGRSFKKLDLIGAKKGDVDVKLIKNKS